MYRVTLLGETNDGKSIDRELGTFDTREQAEELAFQINGLVRDDLLCTYRSMLEWRIDISMEDIDGTYTCVGIMDSDKDELKEC